VDREPVAFAIAHRMDGLPVDQHAPGARLIAAGDELEQGRLARAVRPHHTDDRRPVDREVGVQREGGLSLRPAALVALGQRLDTQQRVRHLSCSIALCATRDA